MLQICAEKCWICIDGICIFVREVMRVLFRNNSKVLLHFRNAFTLPCPPLCKYRFWCFYCRTISKCGELDAFLLPFFKEIRFLWWWEEPCLKPEGREFWLLMAEVKIALGKLVAWRLVHLFFCCSLLCYKYVGMSKEKTEQLFSMSSLHQRQNFSSALLFEQIWYNPLLLFPKGEKYSIS